ncbi:MAG TPA: hypothetical protein VJV75_09015 [Candidatus Polarisedimenticolia bacterium]|nr:hypothetical protein [Candidatus Polarisedimenticolia bacterium]
MRRQQRSTVVATGRILAALVLVAVGATAPILAQQSASFRLTEWTLNSGGDPLNGTSAGSASWKIRLDAIGDAVLGVGQGSGSYHMDSGFVDVYAPPGEVQNQIFTSATVQVWDRERSAGLYEVYRGLISGLPGGFGACSQSSLASPTITDAGTPPLGDGWFYFVTARNRLGEEGVKGYTTAGPVRSNAAPCP